MLAFASLACGYRVMATLIKADGTSLQVKPKKGKTFTLEELQERLGGLIEAREPFIFNEDGRALKLPENMVVHERLDLFCAATCLNFPKASGRDSQNDPSLPLALAVTGGAWDSQLEAVLRHSAVAPADLRGHPRHLLPPLANDPEARRPEDARLPCGEIGLRDWLQLGYSGARNGPFLFGASPLAAVGIEPTRPLRSRGF